MALLLRFDVRKAYGSATGARPSSCSSANTDFAAAPIGVRSRSSQKMAIHIVCVAPLSLLWRVEPIRAGHVEDHRYPWLAPSLSRRIPRIVPAPSCSTATRAKLASTSRGRRGCTSAPAGPPGIDHPRPLKAGGEGEVAAGVRPASTLRASQGRRWTAARTPASAASASFSRGAAKSRKARTLAAMARPCG